MCLKQGSVDFDSHCADKVVSIVKDPMLCRLIPREASTNPLSISLASLAYCIEPSELGDKAKMKMQLLSTGCLGCIVNVASEQEKSLNDPQPTMETVQKLWRLQKYALEFRFRFSTQNLNVIISLQVSEYFRACILRLPRK